MDLCTSHIMVVCTYTAHPMQLCTYEEICTYIHTYGYAHVHTYMYKYICNSHLNHTPKSFMYIYRTHNAVMYTYMGWLRLVGSIQLQVSFAKEPYQRDDILQKRPIILSILLTVATPYHPPSGYSNELVSRDNNL